MIDRRLSIAPMIDYTHRHFRYFFRLMTQHALLYTEMVTSNALLYSSKPSLTAYSSQELPVAFQLGGSVPKDLATCVVSLEKAGFSEVNLNLGCPSPRVQEGAFGAVLMKDKRLASDCFKAMLDASDKIPVTVKCRIGVDEFDSDQYFFDFIDSLVQAGCKTFIVHARIAYLKGLSPKENRSIPPLNYPRVLRLKETCNEIEVILNGGLESFLQLETFNSLDGLMFGRKATQDPFYFSKADLVLGKSTKSVSRLSLLESYFPYLKAEYENKQNLNVLLKPLQGLYFGEAGAKKFKQRLSQVANSDDPINEYQKLLRPL
jgi:tRNA-dihydrouridine synthase A